jgi:hypothetical protein
MTPRYDWAWLLYSQDRFIRRWHLPSGGTLREFLTALLGIGKTKFHFGLTLRGTQVYAVECKDEEGKLFLWPRMKKMKIMGNIFKYSEVRAKVAVTTLFIHFIHSSTSFI